MTSKHDAIAAGAAMMISRRGVGAVSVRELAAFTGSPLGSTYHYFPGGKQQIIDEAVDWIRGGILRLLESNESPHAAFAAFARSWREQLTAHDFDVSCPVMSVATSEGDTTRATETFSAWHQALTQALARHEIDEPESMAWFMLAAVEGAITLSRSQRSFAPLDAATQQILAMLPQQAE